MKKRLLAVACLIVMLFYCPQALAVSENEKFTIQFWELYESDGIEAGNEFIQNAGAHRAFIETVTVSHGGIIRVAQGQDAAYDHIVSEAMAEAYKTVFGKDGLLRLITRYNAYSSEECKKFINGYQIVNDAVTLYEKGQKEESFMQMKFVELLFKKLGDDKGLADAIMFQGNYFASSGQLDEALSIHLQAVKLYRDIGDLRGEAAENMQAGSVLQKLERPNDAMTYYQSALDLFKLLGDLNSQAMMSHAIGSCLQTLGYDQKATHLFSAAVELYRQTGDKASEAMSWESLSASCANMGLYEKALICETSATSLYQEAFDVAGVVRSLTSVAQYRETLGQYNQADQMYAVIADFCKATEDKTCQMDSLINQGNISSRNGEFEIARGHFKKALDLARELGGTEPALVLNHLGIASGSLGKFAEAFDYYRQAADIWEAAGDHLSLATCQSTMGVFYQTIGQDDKSLVLFEKALTLFKKVNLSGGQATCYLGIGDALARQGQYKSALRNMEKALEINKETALEAVTLTTMGRIHRSAGNYAEAVAILKRAVEVKRRLGDAAPGDPLLTLGGTYLKMERYTEALIAFDEALEQIKLNRSPFTEFDVNIGMGFALWKSGDARTALSHYARAVEALESMHRFTEGLAEESRTAFLSERRYVFKEYVDLLLELHRLHPDKGYDRQAFLISEKSKSRLFQDLMAKAGARIAFSGDAAFQATLQKERELTALSATFKSRLIKARTQEDGQAEIITSLESRLAQSEDTLRRLEKEIEQTYPRYADLKRARDLGVADLQAILTPTETFLAYAVGRENTAAFLIRPDFFKMVDLGIGGAELEIQVKRFRKGLAGIDPGNWLASLQQFDPAVAHGLYKTLFEPLAGDVGDAAVILLSADDILYTLPFEALVDKKIDKDTFMAARQQSLKGAQDYLSEYQGLHYLADSHAIAYLPSATVLRSQRQFAKAGGDNWSKQIVAFADRVFSAGELKGGSGQTRGISVVSKMSQEILATSTGGFTLARLEDTADEARAIVGEVSGRLQDIYMREQATEANVFKADLKDARYILFSTHGLLGGEFNGVAEPALVMSLLDNPPETDGFLGMSEVLGLDLNAELVILSACNTSGRGDKAGKGEGFAGLTRSFMYAGARSLLVTHWSVESQAATDLMVGTFQNLDGKSKAQALRAAKLKMKDSFRALPGKEKRLSLAHPFYWAPYVLVGDDK